MILRRWSKSLSLARSWELSSASSSDVRVVGSAFQSVHFAGINERLPSGRATRTKRTPRRRILLIAANARPSKA